MEKDILRATVSKMYGVITIDSDLQRFFESSVGEFVNSVASEDPEHELSWTQLYREFEALMEEKLEDIAISLGFTKVKDFYDALKTRLEASDNNGTDVQKRERMLNLLVASYDYEKFVALMMIKARKVVEKQRTKQRHGEEKDRDEEEGGDSAVDSGSEEETKEEGKEGEAHDPHEMFYNEDDPEDY